jgi:uncharacterized protein DUF4349
MQRFWQSIVDSLKILSRSRRQLAFIAAVVFVIALLTALTSHHPSSIRTLPKPNSVASQAFPENLPPAILVPGSEDDLRTRTMAAQSFTAGSLTRATDLPTSSDDARMAYSADLAVITRDFVHARSSLDEILDRHRGYAARLRMVGRSAGSSLSATLKVPASEYSSALTDLKSIGDVQQDDEAADEVVQQRGDLEARLQNAKNNERRLQQLLQDSNDKSIDVDYVRRQLVALHAEIVQLELQRHNVDSRVLFSNIHFALSEVRETPAETLSAQLRHAAASGLTDLIASLSTLLIFVVSYGPSLLLWSAVLFFPARYLWRRSRVSNVQATV